MIVEPPHIVFEEVGLGICVDSEGNLPNGKVMDHKSSEKCREECLDDKNCIGFSTVKAGKGNRRNSYFLSPK